MKIKRYIENNYAIITLWTLMFFVMWIQIVPQTGSIVESTLFVICFLALCYPFTKYLSETLLSKAIREKKISTFIAQMALFSVIDGGFFVGLLYFFNNLEQQGIYPHSRYFELDVPYVMFLVPISAGIIINICICGLKFFQENTKLKRVLIEYQLRTLQHQVTPHFMFNVLNHIHILMQTDVSLASDLLIKYSDILRYQLYSVDKQDVTIEQDICFLKDFIAVEELRWEKNLSVTSEWKVENPQLKIPALLFISFIENAFKFVSKSDFEKGYINICFEQKANIIHLDIINSKSSLSTTKEKTGGLGLKNIKERLDILYYDKHTLYIEDNDTRYRVKLTITIKQ